jgi:hypothetical protein
MSGTRSSQAQQDTKHLPQILTNSAKNEYKKNPRRVYGARLQNRNRGGGNDGLIESEENIEPFPSLPTVPENY